MTEKEKMLTGEMYDPLDPQLMEERHQARMLFQEFNRIDEDNKTKRDAVLRKLIPQSGSDLWVEPPFYCDYGRNIRLGNQVFIVIPPSVIWSQNTSVNVPSKSIK